MSFTVFSVKQYVVLGFKFVTSRRSNEFVIEGMGAPSIGLLLSKLSSLRSFGFMWMSYWVVILVLLSLLGAVQDKRMVV